ncbi:hypothetical protein [Paenibacillus anaericanus]|uniref:hypothetical protein n=1 Tax=Paenibacillus anaericanus TaxID=170367 RepID=UPI001476FE87|nr:hypothetical protein [Paenibacillus anaericanus]
MSKYHLRKLQNEVNKHGKHRVKRLVHSLRFGKLSEDGTEEAQRQLLVIGGGV